MWTYLSSVIYSILSVLLYVGGIWVNTLYNGNILHYNIFQIILQLNCNLNYNTRDCNLNFNTQKFASNMYCNLSGASNIYCKIIL